MNTQRNARNTKVQLQCTRMVHLRMCCERERTVQTATCRSCATARHDCSSTCCSVLDKMQHIAPAAQMGETMSVPLLPSREANSDNSKQRYEVASKPSLVFWGPLTGMEGPACRSHRKAIEREPSPTAR